MQDSATFALPKKIPMEKAAMNIQMVDLKRQYQKLKGEIDQAVLDVVSSCAYINGPAVRQFQASMEAYNGVKHVIPCANGTDALQIALMAFDLQPGDEVIVPAFTYVSTAEVIALLRLTPIMVDVDPHTFNITPEIFAAAITPKTKAVVPVNLFGQSCDMEPIMAIAAKHNIYVVEDNAQRFLMGVHKKQEPLGILDVLLFTHLRIWVPTVMEGQYSPIMMIWHKRLGW